MVRKYTKFLFIAFVGFAFVSCDNTNKEETEIIESEIKACVYDYDASATEVGFTAYKFTEKVGVGGTFNTVEITGAEADKNPLNVIKGLSFNIPIDGVNTKDEGRDEKIAKFFFGIAEIDNISGNVVDIDETSGMATISITMRGVTKDVEGEYELDDNNFSFTSNIDVNDWDAEKGIEALNEECHDLHIGEDGVSMLWPEVSISFTTVLTKSCD